MADIFDLLNYEREFPLPLKHPVTNKPIGVTFTVKHRDCEAAQAASNAQLEAGFARAASGEKLDPKQAAKEATSRGLRILAACVTGWDWGEYDFKGEALEFSLENVTRVLSEAHWIHDQVDEGVGKVENFTSP